MAKLKRGEKQVQILARQLWAGLAQRSGWRQLHFFPRFGGAWSLDHSQNEAGMIQQQVLLPLLYTVLRCRPGRLRTLNNLHLPCMPLPDTFNTYAQLLVVNVSSASCCKQNANRP